MPLLEVHNLNAFYGKAQVLRNVSIAVSEGEAVAILGPNGAGKTTLLNSICGFVKVEGRIVFDGKDITFLKPHERVRLGITISPEGRRLFPEMSVEDNLLIAGSSDKLDFLYSLFPNLREKRKERARVKQKK